MLHNAKSIVVDYFTSPHYIVNGSSKLNILFAAAVFNTKHGLTITEKEKQEVE